MDTIQLDLMGSKICPEFLGCVAADMVEIANGYYIVNVDKKNTKGSHWVCIHFDEACSELFDPLGRHPLSYHKAWHDKMLAHSGRYRYNSKPVQGPLTSTCGQFVLYFLYHRCNGFDMEQIVHSLESATLNENERRVTKFLSRLVNAIV